MKLIGQKKVTSTQDVEVDVRESPTFMYDGKFYVMPPLWNPDVVNQSRDYSQLGREAILVVDLVDARAVKSPRP